MLWMAPKPKQLPSQGPDTPLQQDSKDNIQQAAASQLLAYKPAAWDHWRADRSEQHTAATTRNIQGDLKQAIPRFQVFPGTRRNACSATALQHSRYPQHTLCSRKERQAGVREGAQQHTVCSQRQS